MGADGLAGRRRTLLLAAMAQATGIACAVCTAWAVARGLGVALPLPLIALAAGIAAAACGTLFGLPKWWRVIHALFPAAAWGAFVLDPDPAWFLVAFGACVLLFGGAAGGAVPLYLSSRRDIAALSELMPAGAQLRVLDAGCGIGSVLAGLRERRPRALLEGVESSLLPWLAARSRGCRVRWGSLWRCDFARYDLVYAFLSPAPMGRLWHRARREMRPGSLLVSNRFAVPGVEPTFTLVIGPGERRLHVWRM